MYKLLTIKHWQLFLLLYGAPFFIEIIIMIGVASGNFNMAYAFVPCMLLYMGVFFGWFYTLGTNLNRLLPADAGLNLKRFKVFLFIPAIYIFVICIVIASVAFGIINNGGHVSPMVIIPIVLLILPLHLFSMFCIFYCLYFNAKSLKSVELQRPVTFNDYAGEFFLIWFFPVGVWFI